MSPVEMNLEARFDAYVAEEKIEPKDWMPDAYRKIKSASMPTAKLSACCPRATGSAAPRA